MCGICSLNNSLLHPSKQLQQLYAKKCYQGQNPAKAEIIFVGIDANWVCDIDCEKKYQKTWPLVKKYLDNGVTFWEDHGFHHPFLSPYYEGDKRRGGVQYHRKFKRIYTKYGISPSTLINSVSFVELVGFPTIGSSTKNKSALNQLIYSTDNRSHLKQLDEKLNDSSKKIFIAHTVAKEFQKISKQPDLGLFQIFRNKDLSVSKDQSKGDVFFKIPETTIYVHSHFSCRGFKESVLQKIAQNI
ncbi:MAG: hypothetical protein LBR60_00295 [Fibrobacter sp.]|jgi:hypothetical protein|nr:hypothetical protein [Fibrobacter sp.]